MIRRTLNLITAAAILTAAVLVAAPAQGANPTPTQEIEAARTMWAGYTPVYVEVPTGVNAAPVEQVQVALWKEGLYANHITKWDGFFWTQTRYVTSTQTLQARWCVDQYDQDAVWLYVGNSSSQVFTYEVWFEAGTAPSLQWAYYAQNVQPHSSFVFYPGITPKTQAYHPRWDVWRNGVHLAYMDIWGSTPGEMAKGAAVSNC